MLLQMEKFIELDRVQRYVGALVREWKRLVSGDLLTRGRTLASMITTLFPQLRLLESCQSTQRYSNGNVASIAI
jgi:hypothetical protein